MTKISNQYSLTNILTADLANSRLGINNVSPTVALDVTGAGKFSGVLTLGSTISNGTNTYTLPSATGTLALTSALSGYLLLTGGTLTGALSGTSAAFSGLVSLGGATATNPLNIRTANGESYIRFLNADGTTYGDFERSITGSGAIRFTGAYFRVTGTLETQAITGTSATFRVSDNRNLAIKYDTNITLSGQADSGAPENLRIYADTFKIFTSTTTVGLTERLTVSNNGNVGIGTSSPTTLLHLSSTYNGGGTGQMHMTSNGTEGGTITFEKTSGTTYKYKMGLGTNNFFIYNETAGNQPFTITSGSNFLMGTTSDNGERLYVSGAIRATSTITANSDIRIKSNITKIENALEKVGQISGYTYNTDYDDKRHGGVIAQEIDKVFPEIVNTGNDGLMGVEYGNISALLIEAIKELSAKVSLLENK